MCKPGELQETSDLCACQTRVFAISTKLLLGDQILICMLLFSRFICLIFCLYQLKLTLIKTIGIYFFKISRGSNNYFPHSVRVCVYIYIYIYIDIVSAVSIRTPAKNEMGPFMGVRLS